MAEPSIFEMIIAQKTAPFRREQERKKLLEQQKTGLANAVGSPGIESFGAPNVRNEGLRSFANNQIPQGGLIPAARQGGGGFRANIAEGQNPIDAQQQLFSELTSVPGFEKIGLQGLIDTTTPQPQGALEKVMDKNGSPIFVNRADALGRQPFSQPMVSNTFNAGGGDVKVPEGFMRNPDTKDKSNLVIPIPGGPQDRKLKASEAETKSAGFANRMYNTTNIINNLEAKAGFDPADTSDAALTAIPFFGNMMVSEDRQRYTQAKTDWVTANLRKESGAVLGKEEVQDEIAKYFPIPGDKPATIRQKKRSRDRLNANMRAGSKGLFDTMYPDSVPKKANPFANMSLEQLDAERKKILSKGK